MIFLCIYLVLNFNLIISCDPWSQKVNHVSDYIHYICLTYSISLFIEVQAPGAGTLLFLVDYYSALKLFVSQEAEEQTLINVADTSHVSLTTQVTKIRPIRPDFGAIWALFRFEP